MNTDYNIINITVGRLLEKSQEAFILAIEIYNKPTIKYRVEGFSFFICNAWELLLKAKIIYDSKSIDSIYYKDNPNRTIGIGKCIDKIFTNKKDPLRLNLESIITLRNTSTHFIVQEYEQIYVPLFQANIKNYGDKLLEFFDIDITDSIPDNFLTLSVNYNPITLEELNAKYSSDIVNKILNIKDNIMHERAMLDGGSNPKYSISIRHDFYITKNKNKANALLAIDRTADITGNIIKQIQDPQNVYPYTYNNIIKHVNEYLERNKLDLYDHKNNLIENKAKNSPKGKDEYKVFNKFHLDLFISFYNMKNDEKYSYKYQYATTPYYGYSQRAVDLIINSIKNDNKIIGKIYEEMEKNNKS